MKRLLFLLALAAPVIFGQCPGYQYYKLATIPHVQVGGSLTNYNAWFSLSDPDLRTVSNGGKVQNQNGYDIVFANSTGKTFYQFEANTAAYSATNGTLYGFVQMPSLNNTSDSQVEVCFGNQNIRSYQGQPLTGAASLWSGYSSVWHFYGGSLSDASPTGNNLTAVNSPIAGNDFLGGTYSLVSAGSQNLKATNPLMSTASAAITVSMWVKTMTTTTWGPTLDTRTNGGSNNYFLGLNPAGNTIWIRNGYAGMSYGSGLNDGQWHYIVGSGDPYYTSYLYIDGAQYTSSAGGGNMALVTAALNIGCNYVGTTCGTGKIAEVRISKGQASLATIQTDINSQKPGSTFLTWGPTQTAPACPTAVCTTGNVTTSGNSAMAAAATGPLTITASSNITYSGQSTFITFNHPVSPSQLQLVTGSIGSVTWLDFYHAIYTAPSHIPMQTVRGGCPVGPNDSIFNTPIDGAPINALETQWWTNRARSDNWPTEIPANGYHLNTGTGFTWPMNVLQNISATKTMKFYYGSYIDPAPYPDLNAAGGFFAREGGWDVDNGAAIDHHTYSLAVNAGANNSPCEFYELYNDNLLANDTATCQDGSGGCNGTSGAHYTADSYATHGGTDAAGLPQYLTITMEEIKNNSIHHPIRMEFSNGQGPHIWPATGDAAVTAGNIPFGARMRLKSSVVCSGCSQYAQNIFNALKTYGAIVADNGGDGWIDFSPDISADPAVINAVFQATGAAGAYFTYSSASGTATATNWDIIDESALQQSSGSYQVNPVVAASYNDFPSGSAAIQALDAAGNSTTIGLELHGVLVGTPQVQYMMAVGTTPYSYQFPSWVTPSSTSQTVTWTLVSGPGSITSGGLYTSPNGGVASPTAVTLQVAPNADLSATHNVYINLIPISSDGNIRIQAANQTTDGKGFTWWVPGNFSSALPVNHGVDSVTWSNLSGNPEATVYEDGAYVGGDWHFAFIVPNSKYRIRYLTGNGGCTGTIPANYHGPNQLDAQYYGVNGVITAHAYRWGDMVNDTCRVAWDYYSYTQVTNNLLDIWQGATIQDFSSWNKAVSSLGAIEIIPDNSAPSIFIDTGFQGWSPTGTFLNASPTVHPGTSWQLWADGWYMSNSVTWSASYGTISPNGLYTAPASDGNTHTVTITATSTVNPAITATATIAVPAS